MRTWQGNEKGKKDGGKLQKRPCQPKGGRPTLLCNSSRHTGAPIGLGGQKTKKKGAMHRKRRGWRKGLPQAGKEPPPARELKAH